MEEGVLMFSVWVISMSPVGSKLMGVTLDEGASLVDIVWVGIFVHQPFGRGFPVLEIKSM